MQTYFGGLAVTQVISTANPHDGLNAFAIPERSRLTMTHISHPIRPARAAIAAVLALTATPLMAQDLAPVAPPPGAPALPQAQPAQPSVPTTALPGTPMATEASQAPTVQAQPPAASLPGTPIASPVAPPAITDMPVANIAPQPSAEAVPSPAPATARAERPAPAPRTARAAPAPAPASQEQAPEAYAEAVTGEDVAALPPLPSGQPLAETPPAEVTAAPAAPADQGDGEVWGWMAALLAALGIGGGAIALRRTRTRKSAAMMAEARASDAEYDRRLASPHARPPVAPGMAAAPATASFAQPVIHPAPARPVARTVHPDSPIDHRRLEALIAQRPNRDNPFKTRANRKRRALFLMRNGYGLQSAA